MRICQTCVSWHGWSRLLEPALYQVHDVHSHVSLYDDSADIHSLVVSMNELVKEISETDFLEGEAVFFCFD